MPVDDRFWELSHGTVDAEDIKSIIWFDDHGDGEPHNCNLSFFV